MKALITILFMLLPAITFGDTHSSLASGDWATPGTWNGGVPDNTDDVTITHAITISTNTLIGSGPADSSTYVVTVNTGGSITLNNGITFTVKGNIKLDNGSSSGALAGLILGAGSTLTIDTSAAGTANYKVAIGQYSFLDINGTSGSHVTFTSNGTPYAVITGVYTDRGGNTQSEYCDFSNLGVNGSSPTAWYQRTKSGSGYNANTSITHSTFTNCGKFDFGATDAGGFVFNDNLFVSTLYSNAAAFMYTGITGNSSTVEMLRNSFIDGVTFYPAGNADVEDNYFQVGIACSTNTTETGTEKGFKTFKNNFVRYNILNSLIEGNLTDSYFVTDYDSTNHCTFQWNAAYDNRTITGSIFDFTYQNDTGDTIMPACYNSKTATFTYNILLPDAIGDTPGKVISMYRAGGLPAGTNIAINHNTYISSGRVGADTWETGVGVGESNYGTANEITSYKSNMIWTPTGHSYPGYKITRQNSTTQDFAASSICDYNWGYNLGAGYDNNGGYQTWYGYRTTTFFSMGVADVNGGTGNPAFFDSTRNMAIADRSYFGNTSVTAWATGQAYVVGDIRSAVNTGIWGSATINYRCILNHTSETGHATNGIPGYKDVTTNWRTNWEFATLYRIRNNPTLITGLINWVKQGYHPTNQSLKGVAHDAGDIGAMSVVPAAPTALQATGGNHQVTLTWTAPPGAITGYIIYRGTVHLGPYTQIDTSEITSYVDTTAENGTTYYYVVSATGSGGEGPQSTEASATPQEPPPAAPTLTSAVPGDQQVTLTWSISSGATSYDVYWGTTSGGPYDAAGSPHNVVAPAVTYIVTGLTNATQYFFVVKAKNAGGSSNYSNEMNGIPAAPPNVPSAPVITTTPGNRQVRVSWAAVTGATSYKLYRSTVAHGVQPPPFTDYAVVASGITALSYTDTGLQNNTWYYYVLTAWNVQGESACSWPESAAYTYEPPAPTPAPTTTTITTLDASQVIKAVYDPVTRALRVESGSLAWTKYSFTYTSFSDNALTKTIELLSLQPAGIIHGVKIKHSAAFGGGSIATYTLQVGITGTLNKYANAYNVHQAPGDTVQQLSTTVGTENHASATSIKITATSTVDTLDHATAGAVDIWVLSSRAN